MAEYLHVHVNTLLKWQRAFTKQGIYPPKFVVAPQYNAKRDKPKPLPKEMEEAVDGLQSAIQGYWTQARIESVNEAIFKSSIGTGKGNANAQKLVQDLIGALKKDREIKFVLSADQYFAIRREAASRIQQLSGEPDGDRGVLSKSPILLSEDGVSTKQEHIQEGEVAALAVPA